MYIRSCAIRTLILWAGATLGVGGCSSNAAPESQAGQLQTAQSRGAAPPGETAQGETPQPAQSSQQYRLTATIPDLMDGIIDPAADVLWDSVAYIATSKGTEDRQPRTDGEWKTVRNSAITLIEAANLLSMPGRRVIAADVSSAGAPRGALSAQAAPMTKAAPSAQAGLTTPAAQPASPPRTAPNVSATMADAPPPLGELSHAEIQQRIDATHDAFTQFARNLQDAGLKALAAINAKDAQGLMDAGGIIDEACEACHVTYWYPNQHRPGT
ncbi:MAG: hypothetical protein ACJ8R9_00225 [Steroidobacteraceae bacterium]